MNATPETRYASSAEIAAAIEDGDTDMEASFCERYYQSIFNLLCHYTKDPFRAEDITHEVLLTVLVKLREGGIDHPGKLTSYVRQTARFSFIGWYRQSERFIWSDSMEDEPDKNTPELNIMHSEQAEITGSLIEALPIPRDRELLRRSYICDENKQSICESLELSTEHYDRVISRARKRLRELMITQDEGLKLALEVA